MPPFLRKGLFDDTHLGLRVFCGLLELLNLLHTQQDLLLKVALLLIGNLDLEQINQAIKQKALDGQAFQVVAAPVNAPVLIGWVVFDQALGAGELAGIGLILVGTVVIQLFSRSTTH